MQRITVGEFEVTLIMAGAYHWDGGALFGVVPKTLWGKHLPADERNLVPMAFNCFLVETGEHTVLIETGGGDKMDDRARARMKLPERIQCASNSACGSSSEEKRAATYRAIANDAPQKVSPTAETVCRENRRPKKPLIAAPIKGSTGISQRWREDVIVSADSPGRYSRSRGCGIPQ